MFCVEGVGGGGQVNNIQNDDKTKREFHPVETPVEIEVLGNVYKPSKVP